MRPGLLKELCHACLVMVNLCTGSFDNDDNLIMAIYRQHNSFIIEVWVCKSALFLFWCEMSTSAISTPLFYMSILNYSSTWVLGSSNFCDWASAPDSERDPTSPLLDRGDSIKTGGVRDTNEVCHRTHEIWYCRLFIATQMCPYGKTAFLCLHSLTLEPSSYRPTIHLA